MVLELQESHKLIFIIYKKKVAYKLGTKKNI